MPRCPDLAIFVLTDDDDYITPCACARGNNYTIFILGNDYKQEVSICAIVCNRNTTLRRAILPVMAILLQQIIFYFFFVVRGNY